MVREEPSDQGDEPSVRREGVEQEGVQPEPREESEELELGPESESEDEGDFVVPSEADSVVEAAEDEKLIAEYVCSRSDCSARRCQDLDPMMLEDCEFCVVRDEAANTEKQRTLWPFVLSAVNILRASGRLNEYTIPENCGVTLSFCRDFENAISSLLGKQRPPHAERAQICPIVKKAHTDYENERVRMQMVKSLKFHARRHTRPGWHHRFGAVFPVYASYDMIEYLVYALPRTGFSFDKNMEENKIWHPEFDEQTVEGRQLIEMHFVTDPSFRQEFVDLVKELRSKAGSELSSEEVATVYSIFDQMNSLYNLDFEHFLMNEADAVRLRRKLRLSRLRRRHWNTFRRWTQRAELTRQVIEDIMFSRRS